MKMVVMKIVIRRMKPIKKRIVMILETMELLLLNLIIQIQVMKTIMVVHLLNEMKYYY